jgi:alpha-mannosidase
MNVFNKGDATAVRSARKLAEEIFGEGWEAKGERIYDEGAKNAQIWGIGAFSILVYVHQSHGRFI